MQISWRCGSALTEPGESNAVEMHKRAKGSRPEERGRTHLEPDLQNNSIILPSFDKCLICITWARPHSNFTI